MMGKEDMKKMGPAILIALSKKKGSSEEDKPGEESDKGDSSDQEYLEEISSDLIDAVKKEDPKAVADLLKEAFQCLSSDHSEDY